MSFNSGVIGNELVQKITQELFIKKKLPHALIFSGIQGIGKYTYAIKLAKIILSYDINTIPSNVDNLSIDSEINHNIDANSFNNLLVIQPNYDEKSKSYKDIIGIEDIRKINDFLHLTSINNKYRIIIIDSINQLNINASNALLKNLEEPPQNTIFILISHNINKVLNTIISRCFVFKFNKLNHNDLNKIISMKNINLNEDDKNNYLNICDGSLLKLLSLINDDHKIHNELIDILNNDKTDLKIYNFINNLKISGYKNFNFLFDIIYINLIQQKNLSYKNQQNIFKISKIKDTITTLNLDKYSVLANILFEL